MADLFQSYTALSPASPRSDVDSVLNSIVNGLPVAPNLGYPPKVRRASHSSFNSTLLPPDAALALLAIKTLAKDPSGSEFLSSSSNLASLLSLSSNLKDDPDASSEALRCIANTLLLIERARDTFLDKEVNGGETCTLLLEKSSSPDQIFILSRILFLATVSSPEYLIPLVEERHHGRTIVEIISSKLDTLSVGVLAGAKMAREGMTDLLKLTFNILLHYPKMVRTESLTPDELEDDNRVMGDFWSPKLDGLLPALLRVFTSLPPAFPSPIAPPMTHVIHALVAIPATPSLLPLWIGTSGSSSKISSTNSPKSPISQSPQAESSPSSRSDSPTRLTQSPSSPKPSTLDRALSVLSVGRRSLSRSPSPNAPTNVLQRACDLLDVSLSHYFPGTIEADDQEVRERIKRELVDNTLDEVLPPLVLLIGKLCIADEVSRAAVRQWLVPDDLDRTSPLEGRADTLGRCLRLLSSVYYPRVKDTIGEMLFAMADSNPSTLSTLVGYGNVAGFLFHKGIVVAPQQDAGSSSAKLTTPEGVLINPVTGTIMEEKLDLPDMTDEEKEREMEKLMVLFDRMEKIGALSPDQNPIRKAIQEGKMQG
ncbi:guanine nucleotide exchange factor [Cyathus striatus]|nr:guanine nucleotide exchange factor [Cyathus striatus]